MPKPLAGPVASVYARFGGAARFAALLKVDRTTPYRWKQEGKIPPTWVPLVIQLARQHRIPFTAAEEKRLYLAACGGAR